MTHPDGLHPLLRILEAEGDNYHRFITKQVEPEHLIQMLDSFTLDGATEGTVRSRALVAGPNGIPSLPRYLDHLKSALRSPAPNLRSVSSIIARDIGIASKVIKLVNSAYLPAGLTVTDLNQAVTYLGIEVIQEMVAHKEIFTVTEDPTPAGLNLGRLWGHSQSVGRIARALILSNTKNSSASEEAYSIGLLHDIGMVVLATRYPDQYRSILSQAAKHQGTLPEMERHEFGTDHDQVGAYLLSLWGLPDSFRDAISKHHKSQLENHHSLTSLALAQAHSAFFQRVPSYGMIGSQEGETERFTNSQDLYDEWSALADSWRMARQH